MKIFTHIVVVFVLATSLFAQPPAKATDQEQKDADRPSNFYKLTFVLYEIEGGKRVNQRDYTIVGKSESHPAPSIRISTRIPVYSEEKKMQYIDAGLNLSCNLREQQGGKVEAQCDINVSGFVLHDDVPAARGNGVAPTPILRSTSSNSWSLLALGKAALIASIDDINSTKRMQIELTATKVE